MTVHSSQIAPGSGQFLSKLGPRGSRADEKAARKAQEAAEMRVCYRAVDVRDQGRCRVCGRRCSTSAVGLLNKAEHHHMAYRSQGGGHTTDNVLTLCMAVCHVEIHSRGTLRVSGNADLTDATGKFCGVVVERLTEAGWRTERMC